MKYNHSYNNGTFEQYLEYLSGIQEKLPKEIFDFTSNPLKHDLGKESLHDSWVKALNFTADFENKQNELKLVLLGAYHDREFEFIFSGVENYRLSQRLDDLMGLDLIAFEIGVEKIKEEKNKEFIVFRASFAEEGSEIEIFSKEIRIKENID